MAEFSDRDVEFSDFVATRWKRLVRSAVVLGCSLYEAEDLAQTALMKCYRNWHRVKAVEERDAYLYRVMVNTRIDSRRRRWWAEEPTASLPDSETGDTESTMTTVLAVQQALADLSIDQRRVVALRVVADVSERHTAEILSLSPGTVKSRLSRALDRLALSPHLSDFTEGGRND